MKNLILKLLFSGALIFVWHFGVAQDGTSQRKLEGLYQQWHVILEGNGIITEPLYFLTNSTSPTLRELSAVNREINSNKIAMTYYLAQRIAAETNDPGDEVDLLEHVSGINLWSADHPTDDIGGEITRNLVIFREEWPAGVYKDPSKKIAQLCEQRMSKESTAKINPRDLSAIRRYGIFGLPELVRQMKKNNSKHAFAAYLVMVHDEDQYRDYLEHSDQQFTNVVDKINHVKNKFHEMDANAGGDFDVMKKISSALSEN